MDERSWINSGEWVPFDLEIKDVEINYGGYVLNTLQKVQIRKIISLCQSVKLLKKKKSYLKKKPCGRN
ncbi:hypothetical protein BU641_08285 [Staphylococcus chromogenes]|nr:hypothetical protein BU641_08285 [Staphylococcus chromogenes]